MAISPVDETYLRDHIGDYFDEGFITAFKLAYATWGLPATVQTTTVDDFHDLCDVIMHGGVYGGPVSPADQQKIRDYFDIADDPIGWWTPDSYDIYDASWPQLGANTTTVLTATVQELMDLINTLP